MTEKYQNNKKISFDNFGATEVVKKLSNFSVSR